MATSGARYGRLGVQWGSTRGGRKRIRNSIIDAPQSVSKLARRLVSMVRLTSERLEDDLLYLRRYPRIQVAERRRISDQSPRHDCASVATAERRLACEHLVQDHADGVHIRPRVHWLCFNLLRGDVFSGAFALPLAQPRRSGGCAIPKSSRRARPCSSTMTLPGFTSQ